MIDVITKVKSKDKEIVLFGKVCEENKSVQLNTLIDNLEVDEFCKGIIYQPPCDILVLDTTAQSYVLYNCKFFKNTLSISQAGVTSLFGKFDRLVKEIEINKQYDTALFTFEGIEKIFPLEKFETEFEGESGILKFIKEKSIKYGCELLESLSCEVVSDIKGAVKSIKLYEPQIKQKKVIKLTFKDKKSKDEIIEKILQVKKYFEFLVRQELKISDIVFKNENPLDHYNGYLLCDDILEPKTKIKPLIDNPYRDSFDNLFVGLKGWMNNFEFYSEVIKIWQKTIYNLNISNDDKFIWYCQAFELLCTLNTEIYEKAKTLKATNQEHPNVKNFLQATRDLFDICKGLDDKHFQNVKNVRDKITHNNPKKIITQTQRENALQLIEFAFFDTMEQIMNIKGIPLGFMLKGE